MPRPRNCKRTDPSLVNLNITAEMFNCFLSFLNSLKNLTKENAVMSRDQAMYSRLFNKMMKESVPVYGSVRITLLPREAAFLLFSFVKLFELYEFEKNPEDYFLELLETSDGASQINAKCNRNEITESI